MAPTNVELYEALKRSIGEDAARMIAEVVPPSRDLATSLDVASVRETLSAEIASVRQEIVVLRGEMRDGFAQARADAHADRVSTLKWMIGLMIPTLAGTWGAVIAIVLKG